MSLSLSSSINWSTVINNWLTLQRSLLWGHRRHRRATVFHDQLRTTSSRCISTNSLGFSATAVSSPPSSFLLFHRYTYDFRIGNATVNSGLLTGTSGIARPHVYLVFYFYFYFCFTCYFFVFLFIYFLFLFLFVFTRYFFSIYLFLFVFTRYFFFYLFFFYFFYLLFFFISIYLVFFSFPHFLRFFVCSFLVFFGICSGGFFF